MLQYGVGSTIEGVLAFSPKDGDNYKQGTYSQVAELWLDEIEVPSEWRPDYAACSYYYVVGKEPNEALFMWNSDEKKLHIVESFM